MNMARYIFCTANRGAVLSAAAEALKSRGYGVVDYPSESATHLLLPVPSVPDGDLDGLLAQLPGDITIVGGNLDPGKFPSYRLMDLLKDPT